MSRPTATDILISAMENADNMDDVIVLFRKDERGGWHTNCPTETFTYLCELMKYINCQSDVKRSMDASDQP